jgi:catalase
VPWKAETLVKLLAAWGDGVAILHAAGITPGDPGMGIADSVDPAFTAKLAAGLGLHRAWDRAAAVMASAAPPAG